MPVVATEDFSGAADALVRGKTTTTGGLTHSVSGQYAIHLDSFRLTGSGAGKTSVSSPVVDMLNAGSADHYSQVMALAAPLLAGPAVRITDYLNLIFVRVNSTSQLSLQKRVGGTQTTVANIARTNAAGDVYRLEATGSSPVNVKVFANGVQVGDAAGYNITDSVFASATLAGFFWSSSYNPAVDDLEIGTLGGGASSISIVGGPALNAVVQRAPGATSKSVAFSGTYTGADPASLQAQVETGGGTVVSAWSGVSGASIAAGAWSANITVPQSAQWLVVKVRARDSGGATLAETTSSKFGVGILAMIDGQSNAANMATTPGGSAPSVPFSKWNGSAWVETTGGAGERAFVQELASLSGVIVGIANTGVSATGIAQHSPPSGSLWTNTADQIAAMGGDVELLTWAQGESDVSGSDVSAAYSASAQSIADGMLTLTGRTAAQFRMLMSVTGRSEGGTGADAGWQSVRYGQHLAAVAHAAIDLSHDCIDLQMDDSLHYGPAGQTEHGYRFARSAAKWLGASAYDGRGPRVASASISGSTVTVAFDLNGSASLTGTGTLTGWEFFSGTAWAAATDAARVGNTVTFTGAGATAVRHLYGQDPDVSNLARGNLTPSASSSVALPVEPTRSDVAVTAASYAVEAAAALSRSVRAYVSGTTSLARSVRNFVEGASTLARSVAGYASGSSTIARSISAAGFATGASTIARSVRAYASGSSTLARSISGTAFATGASTIARRIGAFVTGTTVLRRSIAGSGATVWPATRAGEAATARVPFDGVRVIVPDADDPAAPVKAIPLYVADTERILVDWEAKYLPGAGDTAATVLALDAPAGVAVTPSVAPGAALTTGVVVLAVTPTGAAGTYRVALRIGTAGGRESTALVDVVVSAAVQSAKTFRLRSTADRDVFDLDFAAKYLSGAADVADVLLATSADAGLTADARLDVGGVVQVAVDNPDAPGTYQVRTQLQTAAGRRKTGAIDVEVLA